MPTDPDPTATGVTPPRTAFGRFKIVSFLGKGGMGTVYLAEEEGLGRRVALKVLPETADPVAVGRFRREAQAVANLAHPRIAQVLTFGEDNGTLYYAMEYVEGKSLRGVMDTERLEFPRAAKIAREIAEALAHAHERGVIHRDIKPANVLIDRDGRVKVVDFGLARVTTERSLTTTGELLGTPKYMSPEQADGQGGLGPATDVYSIGATLFEMVALHPPFDEDDPARLLVRIVLDEPPRPGELRAGIPRDLETVIMKCLEKEPASRYATAQHLADDLGRFLAGDPVVARPIGALTRLWRRARKYRATLAIVAAVLLLASAALGVQIFRAARDRARFEARQDAQTVLDQAGTRANRARESFYRFGGNLDGFRREMESCAAQALLALNADPDWSSPVSAAGDFYREAGLARPARDAYARALQLDPGDPAAHLGLAEASIADAAGPLVGLELGAAGASEMMQHSMDEARKHLDAIREAGRLPPGLSDRLAGLMLLAAPERDSLRKQAQCAQAARLFEMASETSQSPGAMCLWAAIAWGGAAQPENCSRWAEKAARLMPRDSLALIVRGMAEERSGRREAATPIYQQVIEVDKLQPLAYYRRAMSRYHVLKMALENETDEAGAERAYRRFTDAVPEIEADLARTFELDPSPLYLPGRAEFRFMRGFYQYGAGPTCDVTLFDAAIEDYSSIMAVIGESYHLRDHVGGACFFSAMAREKYGTGTLADRLPGIEKSLTASAEHFRILDEATGPSLKLAAYRARSLAHLVRLRKLAGRIGQAEAFREWEQILSTLVEAEKNVRADAERRKTSPDINSAVTLPRLRAFILTWLGRRPEAVAWLNSLLADPSTPDSWRNIIPAVLSDIEKEKSP
ncbi:MAG: protein kinase [Planctomycetes bacterium]|nr:protein kinase [Planctomycetota bacterium]